MARQLVHRRGGRFIPVLCCAMAPLAVQAQDARQPGRSQAEQIRPPGAGAELAQALELAYQAREKYRTINSYSCAFLKRERIDGELRSHEFIQMKVRARPFSVYMKWLGPYRGREVIYVAGRNAGKLLAHETGAKKLAGGTVELDPRSRRAMKNSRHPITDAGIGRLIDQLVTRWELDQKWGETQAVVLPSAKVDDSVCWCVKLVHPYNPRRYGYYRVRVFFDKSHSLPIRFEGYDWPRRGSAPDGELLEEYTYRDLRLNSRLTSLDFSVDNPRYNFGRL